MDLHVAERARLKLSGLVVKGRRSRSAAETRLGMALQAKHVHVAKFEHVRVGRAVRHMAGRATFRLYGRVFEYEGAVLIDVTLEADRVLGS